MIFSSYDFIFWFLPLTLLFYLGALAFGRVQLSKWVLLAASLIFYALWKVEFLPIFLAAILFNYLIGQQFQKKPAVAAQRPAADRALMLVGLIGNLGLLFYYKYLTFFAEQSNFIFGTDFVIEKIIMPLGISFFTFMQLSYLFESFQGRVKEKTSLLDYTQFITFFPHLIAGPIILHKELIPQFNDSARMRVIPENIAVGIFLFAIGLFKKVVIADSLAEYVAIPFDSGSTDLVRAWIGAVGFVFQLYFDFSGYMDMAMGMARMMNFDLPINFDSPYRAKDISTFWRKWHITMTRFFMSYVFMPLAMRAARKHDAHPVGKWRTFTEATALPILLTFLLAGIWHGAGWTFIVFGLLHGAALVIHRLWQMTKIRMPGALAWLLTFLFVTVGFVFFRSPDLERSLKVINGMLGMKGAQIGWDNLHALILLAVCFVIALWPRNSMNYAATFKPTPRTLLAAFALFILALAHIARQAEFLYWQF
ncbi:MAG: MBOAT family protein [Bdellovibrionales bacterium]